MYSSCTYLPQSMHWWVQGNGGILKCFFTLYLYTYGYISAVNRGTIYQIGPVMTAWPTGPWAMPLHICMLHDGTYIVWFAVHIDTSGNKSSHCRHISSVSSIIESFLILYAGMQIQKDYSLHTLLMYIDIAVLFMKIDIQIQSMVSKAGG